ncbi:HU family DNA-binding protein [Clostridium porci]
MKDKPARTGKNPRIGEPMEIQASRVPKFKFGKTVKDQM